MIATLDAVVRTAIPKPGEGVFCACGRRVAVRQAGELLPKARVLGIHSAAVRLYCQGCGSALEVPLTKQWIMPI